MLSLLLLSEVLEDGDDDRSPISTLSNSDSRGECGGSSVLFDRGCEDGGCGNGGCGNGARGWECEGTFVFKVKLGRCEDGIVGGIS